MADDDTTLTLYVVPVGSLLHTSECPHLTVDHLQAMVRATPDDLVSTDVCSSCRAALDGSRRRTFASVDDALEAYQAPVENRTVVRQVVASLPQAYVWMPPGGSYVGISAGQGTEAAAYVGKGYVDVHTASGTYERTWLPTNGSRGPRGSAAERAASRETVCPTCRTVLPGTGRCDTCE